MKWIKRILITLGVIVGLLLVAVVGILWWLRLPSTAAGMSAKAVCSAKFVAGRSGDAAQLMAEDVTPASPFFGLTAISIDEQQHTVTGKFLGLIKRQASLTTDRGCVLDLPADPTAQPYTPKPNNPAPWPQGDAAAPVSDWPQGIKGQQLEKVLDAAMADSGDPLGQNARGIAVIQDGQMIAIRDGKGFQPNTALHGWSMTKTVAGMLAYKLAVETGLPLDTPVVDAFAPGPAPPWVTAWRQDGRAAIRVRDLFHMRDGLANTEDYNPWGSVPKMLWGATDSAAYAAQALLEAPPASRWRYLSQTANLLAAVSRGRLGDEAAYRRYPSAALFEPIGATTATLESDTAGNWVGSSYLWASVGDWARFGQLMLDDGRWGGRQVIPPGWLALAATPATSQGDGRGYGAQTWRIGDPQQGECKGHGLPPDTLAMIGHWGQVLAMVPSRQAVIVRLGWTFRRQQFDSCAFVAAALRALPP